MVGIRLHNDGAQVGLVPAYQDPAEPGAPDILDPAVHRDRKTGGKFQIPGWHDRDIDVHNDDVGRREELRSKNEADVVAVRAPAFRQVRDGVSREIAVTIAFVPENGDVPARHGDPRPKARVRAGWANKCQFLARSAFHSFRMPGRGARSTPTVRPWI